MLTFVYVKEPNYIDTLDRDRGRKRKKKNWKDKEGVKQIE
jgi:hypothetical protein